MPLHTRKTLHLTGMTCPQCEAAVRNALLSLDGMKEAQVSLRTGTAEISYDALLLDEGSIQAAIEAAGYGVATPKEKRIRVWNGHPGEIADSRSDRGRSPTFHAPGPVRTLLFFTLLLIALPLAGRLPIFGFLPEITASLPSLRACSPWEWVSPCWAPFPCFTASSRVCQVPREPGCWVRMATGVPFSWVF